MDHSLLANAADNSSRIAAACSAKRPNRNMAPARLTMLLATLAACLAHVQADFPIWTRRTDACVKSDPPTPVTGGCRGTQASETTHGTPSSTDLLLVRSGSTPGSPRCLCKCSNASPATAQNSYCVCSLSGHQVDNSTCKPMNVLEQLVRGWHLCREVVRPLAGNNSSILFHLFLPWPPQKCVQTTRDCVLPEGTREALSRLRPAAAVSRSAIGGSACLEK